MENKCESEVKIPFEKEARENKRRENRGWIESTANGQKKRDSGSERDRRETTIGREKEGDKL